MTLVKINSCKEFIVSLCSNKIWVGIKNDSHSNCKTPNMVLCGVNSSISVVPLKNVLRLFHFYLESNQQKDELLFYILDYKKSRVFWKWEDVKI